METTNTHKSSNRALVVIDGGMNFKGNVQTIPSAPKPKLIDQVHQAIHTRHFSPKTEESYVHWIKRFIFFAYQPINAPAPDIHYDNLVTSATQPVIYYAVNRVTKRERIGGFSGDWLSVDRFDLARQVAETVITQDGLQLPEPYSRGWVSELFGVSADDTLIFCSCGFERSDPGSGHYWVCSVELCSQRVTLLSQLEGIWF